MHGKPGIAHRTSDSSSFSVTLIITSHPSVDINRCACTTKVRSFHMATL
jgi:hypothetical protein